MRKPTTARRERQILRVICQGCPDGALGAAPLRQLENYQWSKPDHEALFRALSSFPTASSLTRREQLPARLTRLGFPDIASEDLFQPHGLTLQEAERLIGELVSC